MDELMRLADDGCPLACPEVVPHQFPESNILRDLKRSIRRGKLRAKLAKGDTDYVGKNREVNCKDFSNPQGD